MRRGGGARDLETRDLGDGLFVVHFLVDCRDAMGANLVNTVAEKVAAAQIVMSVSYYGEHGELVLATSDSARTREVLGL